MPSSTKPYRLLEQLYSLHQKNAGLAPLGPALSFWKLRISVRDFANYAVLLVGVIAIYWLPHTWSAQSSNSNHSLATQVPPSPTPSIPATPAKPDRPTLQPPRPHGKTELVTASRPTPSSAPSLTAAPVIATPPPKPAPTAVPKRTSPRTPVTTPEAAPKHVLPKYGARPLASAAEIGSPRNAAPSPTPKPHFVTANASYLRHARDYAATLTEFHFAYVIDHTSHANPVLRGPVRVDFFCFVIGGRKRPVPYPATCQASSDNYERNHEVAIIGLPAWVGAGALNGIQLYLRILGSLSMGVDENGFDEYILTSAFVQNCEAYSAPCGHIFGTSGDDRPGEVFPE